MAKKTTKTKSNRNAKTNWLGIILGGLGLALVLLFAIGPYEDTKIEYRSFFFNDDIDAYLRLTESQYENLTPDTQKQVLWAGEPGEPTELAIVYLHGFSATNYELRPVPQDLGQALNANVYLSRLTGHGLSGKELGEATAQDWLNDLQEALAIGKEIGQKTIVIGSSQGGTLAAIAVQDDTLKAMIDGIVFISPNFRISDPKARMLTWPAARYWVPLVAGKERNWEPHNEMQAKYWTTSYPSTALFPVGALVKNARQYDYSNFDIPALFYFSEDDAVVDARQTMRVQDAWGKQSVFLKPELTPEDDPSAHVIVGEIMSPNQTEFAAGAIQSWIEANITQ